MQIYPRKKTRQIKVGNVLIGGNAPVSVQSMTNTDTSDVEATINQIKILEKAGCEIVRVAVKDRELVVPFAEIKDSVSIPVIADIHFDHSIAIAVLEKGADAVRINPGNIGGKEKLKEVINVCREKKSAMRIGVNSGSIEKEILQKYGAPTAEAMVESALKSVEVCEEESFYNFKVSLKGSNVIETIKAYSKFSERCDYPVHIGITEAGTSVSGAIKSGAGLGILLYNGIGDTLRISLTSDPVNEVKAGYTLLRALGLRKIGVDVISCPTCSRREIDVEKVATEIENELVGCLVPLTVAVMGCVVNGPGEAKEADIGIAGGKGSGILFKRGVKIKKVRETDFVKELLAGVKELIEEKEGGKSV
ncbi:MAG: flavodoxin-dependent (E)-4-hydroxy-3-methylbut-2-enyl-diphosphate synthase [Candidatus Schekmanbacteria bacterium]|nr:MAG: flavodoxin-dependent (E)-4-hydroxy-3-methylbut-2-enyl-diphosphate synthase [Candidatus Schekmanbacteria bacterium]